MKIAFIGLGNMGGPMALNLLKAGQGAQGAWAISLQVFAIMAAADRRQFFPQVF